MPQVLSRARLRFRTVEELTASLGAAGFTVDRVFGDWDRRPAAPDTRELVVIAART